MNAKRLLVIIILVVTVFGSFFVQQPSVKAAGVWNSVAQIVTLDNSMCQELWGRISATRNVVITDKGGGFYLVVFSDNGTLVTIGSHSPGGNCTTSFVGAGVIASWTGGQAVVVQGVLKNPVPANVTVDYTSDHRANKYFLAFFDSVASVQYQSWGWDYSTCGNGVWHDNDPAEAAWAASGPNSLMGDIVGAPNKCQQPAVATQPESCNANSVVLFPYVGHRVRLYVAETRQELQYEKLNFVERGRVNDQDSGKVSIVFYPYSNSWLQYEGVKLLVVVQGYRDGWFWTPTKDPNGHLFCDWSPAFGANPNAK